MNKGFVYKVIIDVLLVGLILYILFTIFEKYLFINNEYNEFSKYISSSDTKLIMEEIDSNNKSDKIDKVYSLDENSLSEYEKANNFKSGKINPFK